MSENILITGIGQDAPYLAKHHLERGDKVFLTDRRKSIPNFDNLLHLGIKEDVEIITADLLDYSSLAKAVQLSKPNRVYNLAAQSHVHRSWDIPEYTWEVTGLGAGRLLDIIYKYTPGTKFYQASSSELFGKVAEVPQRETTPFYPRSPYAVAKQFAHWTTINYRESYDLWACCGILFNHGSPLRGEEFVEQKIVRGAVDISLGKKTHLYLGNLEAKRDIGHAADYTRGMMLMLDQQHPDEYVLATGETTSIRDIVKIVFDRLNLSIEDHVRIDPKFFRPAEVDILLGDCTKAKNELNWQPEYDLKRLLYEMIDFYQRTV